MKPLTLLLAIASLALSSCSVMKAVNQPDAKNLSVLKVGTPRDHVIAELGAPVHTEGPATAKVDIFSFVHGYSKGNKAARAAWHSVADVFTIGLWEVVGTPAESIADGTEIKAEVRYDYNQRVKKVTPYKGHKKLETVVNDP